MLLLANAIMISRKPPRAQSAITGMSRFSIFILVSCISCLRDLTDNGRLVLQSILMHGLTLLAAKMFVQKKFREELARGC